VVNYKVTAQVPKVAEVKPGMTANMTILIDQKTGVLTVPSRAVLVDGDNKKTRVVTNSKKGLYEDRQVKTGLEGDGGLVEILSGLSEGEEVVTLIKQK
jgi:multidrug efflux pump subunit AcrA (membrane-fusion protein)